MFAVDWKFLTTLVAAIAGVLVPVLLWQFDISSKSLELRLVSSVALQPAVGTTTQDLQVFLGGSKLEDPYLSTLELKNDGAKPIASVDFEMPLELRLTEGKQIDRAQLSGSTPPSIPGDLEVVGKVVRLQPLLLNPNDSLRITVISSGGAPTFESFARISGISQVAYEDTTKRKRGWADAVFLLSISAASIVLYMYFAAFAIIPGYSAPPILISAGTMLIMLVAGNAFMRIGFRQIGIESSSVWVTFYLFAALLIGVPVFLREIRRRGRELRAA